MLTTLAACRNLIRPKRDRGGDPSQAFCGAHATGFAPMWAATDRLPVQDFTNEFVPASLRRGCDVPRGGPPIPHVHLAMRVDGIPAKLRAVAP